MVCLCQELCAEFLANDVPPGRWRLARLNARLIRGLRAPLSSCIFLYFLICEQVLGSTEIFTVNYVLQPEL